MVTSRLFKQPTNITLFYSSIINDSSASQLGQILNIPASITVCDPLNIIAQLEQDILINLVPCFFGFSLTSKCGNLPNFLINFLASISSSYLSSITVAVGLPVNPIVFMTFTNGSFA